MELTDVMTWQSFGSRVAAGVASLRRCQKLPVYLIESVLSGSKMDLLLAKTDHIHNDGSTSVIAYFKSEKKISVLTAVVAGERGENM